jgi:hypothetical protein
MLERGNSRGELSAQKGGKVKQTPPSSIWGVDGAHTNRNQQAVAGARIHYFVCTNVRRLMYIGT